VATVNIADNAVTSAKISAVDAGSDGNGRLSRGRRVRRRFAANKVLVGSGTGAVSASADLQLGRHQESRHRCRRAHSHWMLGVRNRTGSVTAALFRVLSG
jgi:hypothetical protein